MVIQAQDLCTLHACSTSNALDTVLGCNGSIGNDLLSMYFGVEVKKKKKGYFDCRSISIKLAEVD